ncbi:MAG: hypothetical protein HPY59_03500 [Anaerolineae bacterium]|nr:hypothetical protein [Anaerolineae bacterium]
MEKIFYPKSMVVVGVSESPDNLSRNIAENLLRFQYPGEVFLLGRKPGSLQGKPIYSAVEELPEGIDLAVILTPAATVPPLLDGLGRRGIRFAVIETAGFSEFSAEGKALEEEIGRIAKKWGMRIVGPNCIGIINTENGICTVFVRTEPDEMKPGKVSLMAQSGGVVLTCTDLLTASGLGVGKTVSVGNKLDLKESDYLEYFQRDPATDMVMLYLESINEGRELVELAGKGEKPVIVYKSNTSQASAQIAQSHTAALANDESVVDAAFEQYGVTRARTFREMMIAGKAFAMPPVRGSRLAVFSRSGGHAIVSVDTASEYGFELPPYPDALIETARPYFRVDVIDRQNPLDLGTVFNFDAYPALVEEAIKTVAPDAVLLVFNYRCETVPKAREVAERLAKISRQYDTPVALCYFTEMEEIYYLEKNLGYPVFTEVHEAVQALAFSRRRFRRLQLRDQYRKESYDPGVGQDAAARARQILKAAKGSEVQLDQALQICEAYGLALAPWAVAENEQQALQAAASIGYPVALKVAGAGAVHKTDVGGVALDLKDERELAAALQNMQARLEKHGLAGISRFLVQKMAKGGREVILGGKRDASFGPLVLCGLGGIYAEVLRDSAIRLAPLYAGEAREMLAGLRGFKLLQGVRGQPPADLEALAAALLKLSRLMVDLEEVAELDLNPVLAFEHGIQVVDARIVLKT